MIDSIRSIRPFLGAREYIVSRAFYRNWGFNEVELGPTLCLFEKGNFGFYLQDAYVKDWVDNTMVFLEVDDIDGYHTALENLQLPSQYPGVRVSEIRQFHWGREFYVHDPSGILWHIGSFAHRSKP